MVLYQKTELLFKQAGSLKLLKSQYDYRLTFIGLIFREQQFLAPHIVVQGSLAEIRFGLAYLEALSFLAVGWLVWLYARQRLVAVLIDGLCSATAITLTCLPGALVDDPLFSALSTASSAVSILLLLLLLLIFPHDYLFPSSDAEEPVKTRPLLLWGYLALLILSCLLVLFVDLMYWQSLHLPAWAEIFTMSYVTVGIASSITTVIVTYRFAATPRERQQWRLFVSGTILATAPLLILTVIPSPVHLPFIVDSQFSTLSLGLLQLGLGYALLRHQLLLFERYVRRAVAWISGGICLALAGYLVCLVLGFFLSADSLAFRVGIMVVMAPLAPCVWWGAGALIDTLLFRSEMVPNQRLSAKSDSRAYDLPGAALLIIAAAITAFEMLEVGCFVLDEEAGHYQIIPSLPDLSESGPYDAARHRLLRSIERIMRSSSGEESAMD